MLNLYRTLRAAALVVALPLTSLAQGVGIGTTTPNASAALDISSTTKGLLLPRLTLAQRTALTASTTTPPVAGLVIYQTDNTPGLYAFDGAAWVRLGADNLGNHTATQTLDLGTNEIRGNGSSVGIGVSANGGLIIGQGAGNVLVGLGSGPLLDVSGGAINNTFVGQATGNSGTTTAGSTFVGQSAGRYTTTGVRNSFVGASAGANNTTGQYGAFFGTGSGFNNTTGSNNTMLGFQAGTNTSQGSSLTFVGENAGNSNTIGSNNTVLGAGADVTVNNLTNATAIGYQARVSQSNSLVLGNGADVGIGTSAPAAKLDIQGGADANGGNDPAALAFSWRNNGYRHFIRSRHNGVVTGGGNALDFYLNQSTTTAGSSAPGTGNIQVLTLESNNGAPRVGIGTIAPTQALQVAGNVQISGSGNGLKFPDGSTQTTAATGGGDNLGNHTATQTLNLGTNEIRGNGSSVGIGVSANGGLIIGQGVSANVLVGSQAGISLNVGTTVNGPGTVNTFVGTAAGASATTTAGSTLVGAAAGNNNTTGTRNTFVGASAGYSNTTGNYSAFFGTGAGNASVTGNDNTLLGFQAGTNSTTGNGLTFVGFNTGVANLTGSNNTLLGHGADFTSSNLTNATGIGAEVQVSQSNSLVLGNGADVGIGTSTPSARLHVVGSVKIATNNTLEFGAGVAGKQTDAGKIAYQAFSADALDIVGAGTTSTNRKIRFYAEGGAIFNGSVTGVGAFNSSDQRLKQDIRPLTGALALVQALHGRRYQWNALGVQRGGQAQAEQVGVLAQELEQVLPELVNTGPDGYKAVNYAQLTPVLIEAIKEQQQQIEALKAQVAAQADDHAALETLKARAVSAETKAAQAAANTEAFEARLRRLEAGSAQAQR